MSDTLMSIVVDLYEEFGKEALLNAIRASVGASGNKLSYLKAVLNKKGKKDDAQTEMKKAWEQVKKTMRG